MHGMIRFIRGAAGRRLAGLGVMLLLGAYATASMAADVRVSPMGFEFSPTEQARVLNLTNQGKAPVSLQVRIQSWSQRDGQDRLEPTNDIVASPAIMQLAPGQKQVVRLVRRQTAAPAHELSYRILVDELPDKQAPAGTGVKILLRYSLPLFVAPEGAVVKTEDTANAPILVDLSGMRARLTSDNKGKAVLHVSNEGPIHLRLSHLVTTSNSGQEQVVTDGLLGYVLTGQQMSWPVNMSYPLPADHTLKANFNDDREARPIPLDRAGR